MSSRRSSKGICQVVLAWLLAKAPDVVPIPGTRRVMYLAENAAAAHRVTPTGAGELVSVS
jgi:aryl-alcohol dehydrogenase-like predicted oxidoreductase